MTYRHDSSIHQGLLVTMMMQNGPLCKQLPARIRGKVVYLGCSASQPQVSVEVILTGFRSVSRDCHIVNEHYRVKPHI